MAAERICKYNAGSHQCWCSTSNLSLAPAISEQSHLMVSVSAGLMLAHPDVPGTCLLQGCCSAQLDPSGVRHGLLCHTCPAELQADTEQGCPKARLTLQHNPHPQPLLPVLLPYVTPYPTCTQQLLPVAVKGVVGSWSQHGLPKNKHAQDSLYTHGLSYWSNFVHAFAREFCCYCPGKRPISLISYSWLWHVNGSLHNRSR